MNLFMILSVFLSISLISAASNQNNNDPWLAGTWVNQGGNISLILTKGEFTLVLPANTFIGTYTTDTTHEPKWIDFQVLNSAFAPLVPGIYMNETLDGKKQLTLQLPPQSDISKGEAKRPTNFTETALILSESTSKPNVQNDPWLLDTWFDLTGTMSMHFAKKDFTIAFSRTYAILGTYTVDMNKNPMWINLNVISDGEDSFTILGIYKQGDSSENMKQLTIQIQSQDEIQSGGGERPTEFTSEAMVLSNVTVNPIKNDPWLIGEIFADDIEDDEGEGESNDTMTILSFTNTTFAFDWGEWKLSGTFFTNTSKSPMWLDLRAYGSVEAYIPAIYRQSLSTDGKKVLVIELPPIEMVESGNASRPLVFSDEALNLMESSIEECPPTLGCGECVSSCEYTCEVAKKKAKKCQQDCEKAFCELFCEEDDEDEEENEENEKRGRR